MNGAKGNEDKQMRKKSEEKRSTRSRARVNGEGEKHSDAGANNSWRPPFENKENKSPSGMFRFPTIE